MTLLVGAVDLALAAAGEHVVERLVGQEPVVLDRLHREVDAVVGDVGPPDVDELADHLDHLVDVVGGVRDVGRSLEADRVHRLPPHRFALGRDVLPRPFLADRAVDDLVVDVGHVRDQAHVEAGPLEVPAQDVVGERRPSVPDVRRPVHRRPAQVDRHLAGIAERELAHLARGGVVEAQHGHQTTVRTVADEAAPDELPEQVESTSDDPGGMPYDDDLGADADAVRTTRGGPAYDSAKSLTDRNIAIPGRGADRDAGAAPIRAVALGRSRPRHPRQAAAGGACR